VTQKTLTTELHSELLSLLPRLRRFALSLTGSIDDAEDLLHSTVEKALSRLEQFDPNTNLDRWMFRICKNTWLDEWRHRKVRGPAVDITEAAIEPSMDGEAHATRQIEMRELETAMQTLHEEHKMILMLVAVEGYSYKEVSSMLEVPIGTVMSRMARARKKLAAILTAPVDSHTDSASSQFGVPS
jgi:RNA polymerase sigma-70 factor, ECF subfamily